MEGCVLGCHLGLARGAKLKKVCREFPGGLLARILGFHCHGLSSKPG